MKTKKALPVLYILLTFLVVIIFVAFNSEKPDRPLLGEGGENVSVLGVCPPFFLLTETGDTINPITGLNTDKPYSPKQTCGKCHDYELITQGFHFQQGMDEEPLAIQAERMQWVTSPGNYGGPWCSPAPLYQYLSEKNNTNPAVVDMTSFSFVVSCGVCHPGGGSLEFDRDGYRYDEVMRDESSGLVSGGVNNLDGDYHKARWSESGVIEADCNLCHMPGYNNKSRLGHIGNLNFKWASTAASGFGTVKGSVLNNEPVTVSYNKEMFNPDGTIEPHLVREPRNEACLWCHAKPGYKKRGANFNVRTDVHLAAGLKCVDCHPAGMQAVNDLIRGKEVHQFGKGDDPGGHVRDDLDNTMRTCADCHNTGYLGSPVAKHAWLPPVHLEKISCQACHIPERTVKSAHFVASDVYNPGAKIPSKGKHLWTFYGPDMNYWNHYGDLEMMGYEDKPTFNFKPELAKYKGMIYPVNRVHTAWPAIQTEGETGLMQPRMSDIYKMWADHFKNPASYPELSLIKDDNGDGVIEVNTPEEIEALIAAVTQKLEEINYPLEGKRVVWAMNNKIYHNGMEYTEIPIESWEVSPYGNVHKYNHDIFPANSALGINGCTDCHSYRADFFMAPVVKEPFDENGKTVTAPQYAALGLSSFQVHNGIIRENFVKPVLYIFLLLFLLFVMVSGFRYFFKEALDSRWISILSGLLFLGFLFMFSLTLTDGMLSRYMLPARFTLDSYHFGIGIFILILSLLMLALRVKKSEGKFRFPEALQNLFNRYIIAVLILIGLTGVGMLLSNWWVFYSLFDISLVLAMIANIIIVHNLSYIKNHVTTQLF